MSDIYDGNLPGIQSEIIVNPPEPQAAAETKDSLFIFGTSKKGSMNKPLSVTKGDLETVIGEAPAYSPERSLNYAYNIAYAAYGQHDDFNVKLIRVGNATTAKLDLYESLNDAESRVTEHAVSLTIQAKEPGTRGNAATVNVEVGDTAGFAAKVIVGLPNEAGDSIEQSITFDVDGSGVQTGLITDALSLVNAINLNEDIFNAGFEAVLVPLTAEFTIAEGAVNSPTITLSTEQPYSNNLLDITECVGKRTITETILAGQSSTVLDYSVYKTLDTSDKTLTTIKAKIVNEEFDAGIIAGQEKFELSVIDNPFGDNASVANATVSLVRAGIPTELTAGDDYNIVAGEVVLVDDGLLMIAESDPADAALAANDKIMITYEYTLNYSEAKMKSDLAINSVSSYWVGGDQVMFGADQAFPVEVTYSAVFEYVWGDDIIMEDPVSGSVTFINSSNMPLFGSESLDMTVRYLPEMPAPTGDAAVDGGSLAQTSQLAGGSDATSMNAAEYKKAVIKAMGLVGSYPCDSMVVAGAYMSSVGKGIDPESGLTSTGVNMEWTEALLTHLAWKRKYVSDTKAYIADGNWSDFSPEGTLSYLSRLYVTNPYDASTPANEIAKNVDVANFAVIPVAHPLVVGIPAINPYGTTLITGEIIYALSCMLGDKTRSPMSAKRGMPAVVERTAIPNVSFDIISEINAFHWSFFHEDITGGTGAIKPSDAPTLAPKGSDLDRQYVLDVVDLCLRNLREVLSPFIGEGANDTIIAAMENLGRSAMAKMSPTYIKAFSVTVIRSDSDKITGNTQVKLLLTTSREIRNVSVETRLQLV